MENMLGCFERRLNGIAGLRVEVFGPQMLAYHNAR